MAQLLVRKLDDALVKKLKTRASEHGVSVEEEHRRILQQALEPAPEKPAEKEYTLLDHFLKLAEIAPDFDFSRERPRSQPQDTGF